MDLKALDVIALVLLIIGALNWGLMGFFGINLIGVTFGQAAIISRIVYALIGLSALYEIFQWRRMQCRLCA